VALHAPGGLDSPGPVDPAARPPDAPGGPGAPVDVTPGWILADTMGRLAVSNMIGAVLVFVFFDRIAPSPDIAYLVFTGICGAVVSRRAASTQYHWVADGRPPTPSEREIALREPLRLAAWAFAAWLGAAVLFTGLNAVLGETALTIVRNAVGILFGGFTTCLLAFLLTERALRPIFALALAGSPPTHRRYLGVRPRIMLSWALGSAVPLFGIALAVVGPAHVDDPAGPILFLAAVGVVFGWLSMFVAARSVSDPIDGVRAAVGRVEEGRLDVEVTVDDGGEVGLLQAGFNRMVAGLRDRQRLRDLFGRHVGDAVARQALERGIGLGGEQRDASAMFVDLIGSTTLAAERPASEVVDTLNALFGAVVRAVAAEGGWVNKFEGDGALCVFGAPADQPDHAARALRAARSLRNALRAGALDAGIGVSSGTVVAGNVGAEERYEYTVIGDPVNEAARLTDLAKQHPGRVLASEPAVRDAGPAGADWVRVGEFDLRGRGRPTCAYAPPESPGT
jgi:adenylate cyclase